MAEDVQSEKLRAAISSAFWSMRLDPANTPEQAAKKIIAAISASPEMVLRAENAEAEVVRLENEAAALRATLGVITTWLQEASPLLRMIEAALAGAPTLAKLHALDALLLGSGDRVETLESAAKMAILKAGQIIQAISRADGESMRGVPASTRGWCQELQDDLRAALGITVNNPTTTLVP